MDRDLVLEISSIWEVVKVLRVDDSQKRSSTVKKGVDPEWNSETPTFRRETNREQFMKERKKEWTKAKIKRQKKRTQESQTIS